MHSAAQTVRARVALADRLRRARETGRRLWRGAPIAAALCAGVAAGARWMTWPGALSIAAVAGVLAVLAAYVLVARRDRAISDSTAVELDGRARLGGELRSASWFASRDAQDSWVDFHLARAAERLQATDWTELYPPVRARREKAATALLAILALVLALPVAGRAGAHATESGTGAAVRGREALEGVWLPPDIRKQLEDILTAAEGAAAPGATSSLTEREVRDLLARLAQVKDLSNAKEGNRAPDPSASEMGLQGKALDEMVERLRRAAEIPAMSPEVKDAMSDVAEKLSDMSDSQPATPKDPRDAVGAADTPKGAAAQSNRNSGKEDASIQSVKDASPGGGIGVIMMSGDDPKGAQEAGLGLGGGSEDRKGGGRMPDIAAALRKETIEAYKDDTGEKTTLDLRRKTERATATVAYVASSPAAFEKGRATAPPAVPENRRAAVQTYFIRKP